MKSKYLLVASIEGNLEKVKRLVFEWNADVNVQNRYGDTPLHWAVCKGHLDVIKFLLENGADVEAKNKAKETPMCWAAWSGNTEAVKLFKNNLKLTL